jgi:hypothetical protein
VERRCRAVAETGSIHPDFPSAATDEFDREMIRQALANYWRPRLEALSKPPR